MTTHRCAWLVVATTLFSLPLSVQAQHQPSVAERAAEIVVEPDSLTLQVGEKAKLKATVKDEDGNTIETPVIFLSRSRRTVAVGANGEVEAYQPGDFIIVVMVPRPGYINKRDPDAGRIRVEVPVSIPEPPLARIVFKDFPDRLYAGTTVRLRSEVFDASDRPRHNIPIHLASSQTSVARTTEFEEVVAVAPGTFTLTATVEAVVVERRLRVVANPVHRFDLNSSATRVRTGDVVRLETVAKDRDGNLIGDYPVSYFASAIPDPTNPAAPSSAQVDSRGRFVAELPGQYRIAAMAGPHADFATVEVVARKVQREVELVGHGPVLDRHTSDLWVWEGLDGRDYAITGTWGASGHAYIWDVTDPKNMKLIDMVLVDARTVNDVKVSEDGRLAVISREGASNRKNGLLILDITRPAETKILSRFDEHLTGGVHNVFISNNHVYAINNGRSFDVVNISEPKLPYRVASFELDTPDHAVHDVWVVDGVAYSSNWKDGVRLIDVGNGIAGGSPDNPVSFASYADPKGHNHAAFPFKSQSTGKFYVVLGDEFFPSGMNRDNRPTIAGGYMHFVDFSDLENPVEVARYEVPEAGSHNLWVENDVLYIGMYNAGLRVVDISGELMGDLYRQGREIARYRPMHEDSKIPNSPFTWGAQPYKGLIYFSDWNSGLWAVRLVDKEEAQKGSAP